MPRTTVRTDSTSAQVQVRYSMLNETWLTFQWCDELWKCRPYPIPTIRQENQDPSHRQLAVRLLFFRQTFKEHRQPFLVVEVLSVFLQRTLIKNRTCTSNPIHDLVWNSDFTKPPLKWPHGCVITCKHDISHNIHIGFIFLVLHRLYPSSCHSFPQWSI